MRMGMLDDAIREHLELKRLRGADPGQVAREENEALGPVRRHAESAADGDPSAGVIDDDGLKAADEHSLDQHDAPKAEATSAGSSSVGQETVEIDMEQALTDESAASESRQTSQTGGRTTAVGHPAHTHPDAGDSLEWEMPGDQDEASAAGEAGEDEAVEDVLEETPDFLRETPEHERLWFEQRPPRDFDFNE